MFYYPLVLKRHSGCFSTIWLVATKAIRISRRDFLKVDIKNTCNDIMNYVLEQIPPPQPSLPRPRFSLYLSSQLQYGIVVVFHRQCGIFLEELQSIVGQLVKQKTSKKIDMEDQGRQVLDMPDALSLLEETEGASDPLFGVMRDAWLSPSTFTKMIEEYRRETTSPSHPDLTSSVESDLTVSPDTITLREMQPVTIPVAEFEGEELVDQHRDTIDLLLAQADHFPEAGDLERDEMEVERVEGEVDPEKEKTKELTGSTLELQPTAQSSEDAGLLPQEDTGLPAPPREELTPVSVPTPPSPPSTAKRRKTPASQVPDLTYLIGEARARPPPKPLSHVRPQNQSNPSEDEPPPEERARRKRRKRQLIFIDPVTQVTQGDIQRQISNPQIETRSLLLPPPSSQQRRSAAELLNNPCNFLPEEVQFLWRQAATVAPVSGSNLQIREREPSSESADSEREREAAGREEERRELSSKEVPRHVAEPEMFDISDPGSLPLEASDQKEVSREISPLYTPERERSPVARSVSTLQDIPEVQDELPERAAAESSGLQPEPGEPEATVVFKSLFPPEVDRRTVSCTFQRLLEYLSSSKLSAQQDAPYGDIRILPGPAYEEEVHLI